MNEQKPLIPNFTQVPNIIFDEFLSELPPSELKVLLYIFRRTYGFQKNSDKIATSQICNGIKKDGKIIDKGTGLSNRAVIDALRALEKRSLIVVTSKTTHIKHIQLNLTYEDSSQVSLMKIVHKPYEDSSQALMKIVHRQNKEEIKEIKIGSDAAEVSSKKKEQEPFSFEVKFNSMKENPRVDIKIIALYWQYKGFNFDNEDQYNSEFKRCLVPAKELKGYNSKAITETMDFCQENFKIWTLETVGKRIADVIKK